MIILGIADSHESHACIVRDGTLVAAVAEERKSRLKADTGYPKKAIEEVLFLAGVDSTEVDHVAVAGANTTVFQNIYKQDAVFSVQDWVRQNHLYWKPKLLEGRPLNQLDDFRLFCDMVENVEEDPYFDVVELCRAAPESDWPAITNRVRRQAIATHLGIDPNKIRFYRHEDCHIFYGYFSSVYKRVTASVLTIEGMGDDSTATTNLVDPAGTISRIWASDRVQIGRIYRWLTLLLGLKPNQHEYKVMGLAPYGTAYHGEAALTLLRRLHSVADGRIEERLRLPDLYFSMRDALEGVRFDGIAWGLQTWLEETLEAWVDSFVAQTGHRTVVLSGGVAQNIKAMKRIAELKSVDKLWVPPIAGDGSLAIGAAWLAHRRLCPEVEIAGLDSIYLGRGVASHQARQALERSGLSQHDGLTVVERPSAAEVANWLAAGLVVARCAGRMEFGQRALGNRSILADPRNAGSVDRINRKIKYRDFWMPFTPSVLHEAVDEVIENPKQIYSPFMTMAFQLRPEWRGRLPAVIHPADETMRPQMLKSADNPEFYEIVSAFHDLTGVPAVLNTSFNLHGEPIVETPEQAFDTFERSDLDVLLFEDLAIARRLTPGGDTA